MYMGPPVQAGAEGSGECFREGGVTRVVGPPSLAGTFFAVPGREGRREPVLVPFSLVPIWVAMFRLSVP